MSTGKFSMENFLTKTGHVENIMVEMCGGQISKAIMNINQCIELQNLMVENLSCKIDIKKNRNKTNHNQSAVLSMDNIACNINAQDIQLALHILQNNILKTKIDICEISPSQNIIIEKLYLQHKFLAFFQAT